jgi:hypothetical protein
MWRNLTAKNLQIAVSFERESHAITVDAFDCKNYLTIRKDNLLIDLPRENQKTVLFMFFFHASFLSKRIHQQLKTLPCHAMPRPTWPRRAGPCRA